MGVNVILYIVYFETAWYFESKSKMLFAQYKFSYLAP